MKTLNCLIVEDDMLDRDALTMHLENIPEINLIGICEHGVEAAAFLRENNLDLVLSDIDMPGMNGLDLVKSLLNPPVFIFISSHAEHAVESYNLDVVDFISKPVSLPRLTRAISKAMDYINLKTSLVDNKYTEGNFSQKPPHQTTEFFFIKENGEYRKVAHADVLYIESMGNFSRVVTQDAKKYTTLVSLKQMEDQLTGSGYMRIHKQYIVSLSKVKLVKNDGEVKLSDDVTVPLGSLYKQSLMDFIGSHMVNKN